MNKTYLFGAIIVGVVIAGGIIWYSGNTPYSAPASAEAPQAAPAAQPSADTTTQAPSSANPTPAGGAASAIGVQAAASVNTAAAAPQHFTVNGNDETADLKSIKVAKGTPVSITFGADSGTTYHGGLDFRSSVINTGTITPGSTKTVTFTAENSFSFTPYWPSTNIAKPYTIDIVVS